MGIQGLIARATGTNINRGLQRSMARSIARGMVSRMRPANPRARNIGFTF